MSRSIFGLQEVLRDLDVTYEDIEEVMNDISKEVATEILEDAIQNVNGPKVGKVKGGPKIKSISFYRQPYPVGVRTGDLKRSLKIKKMGRARHKVFADMNIANYACWVHDGTASLRARPFLDDSVQGIMDSGIYLDIAGKIIDDAINK